MTKEDVKTDEIIENAQRLQEVLSAAAGELGAFVAQLKEATREVRDEEHDDGPR